MDGNQIEDLKDYHFQWYKNWEEIDGATQSSYHIDSLTAEEFAAYQVRVLKDDYSVDEYFYIANTAGKVNFYLHSEDWRDGYSVGDTVNILAELRDENYELLENTEGYSVEWYHTTDTDAYLSDYDGEIPETFTKLDADGFSYHIDSVTEESFGNYWARLLYKGSLIQSTYYTLRDKAECVQLSVDSIKYGDIGDSIIWQAYLNDNYWEPVSNIEDYDFKWYKWSDEDGDYTKLVNESNIYQLTVAEDSYGSYRLVVYRKNKELAEQYLTLVTSKANVQGAMKISDNCIRVCDSDSWEAKGYGITPGQTGAFTVNLYKNTDDYDSERIKDTSPYVVKWYRMNEYGETCDDAIATGLTLNLLAEENNYGQYTYGIYDSENPEICYSEPSMHTFMMYNRYELATISINREFYADNGKEITLSPEVHYFMGIETPWVYERNLSAYTYKWYQLDEEGQPSKLLSEEFEPKLTVGTDINYGDCEIELFYEGNLIHSASFSVLTNFSKNSPTSGNELHDKSVAGKLL